jgi:hypothetical protein
VAEGAPSPDSLPAQCQLQWPGAWAVVRNELWGQWAWPGCAATTTGKTSRVAANVATRLNRAT